MPIKRVLFFIVILSFLFMLRLAYAEPLWQVAITAGMGSATNRIVLGADETATDGFEFEWDTIALLGGEVEVYFLHPEWNQTHDSFQKDIRLHEPGSSKEWNFLIDVVDPNPDDGVDPIPNYMNQTFTVTWDLSNIPADYPLVLTDEGNSQQTDMRSQASYNFTYTELRQFRVSVTMQTEANYHPYDNNPADWTISNFELLAAINLWSAVPPQLTNFELLELINLWSAGGYCWDAADGAYKTTGC